MNGVLVIDKPRGPTSHDVVAVVRRAIREKRIGHTGTLDPLATGVLPLVVGQATRLASLLSASEKDYVADVRFGATSPTFDAEGRMSRDAGSPTVEPPAEPPGLSADAVARVLPEFGGTYLQTPPVFSAKKTSGIRAYQQARKNETPRLTPVRVTVSTLSLESYTAGMARIRLRASAGFYVRSFAHDLGQRLGCGAYLEALTRTSAAGFCLEDAVALDVVVQEPARAVERMVPMHRLLPDLPAVTLNERGLRRATHGNTLSLGDLAHTGGAHESSAAFAATSSRVRVFDPDGQLLAIATRLENGLLHPAIVLM
jgi:tRNA pseudouridine55 synthase